jgi:hypothetical protein
MAVTGLGKIEATRMRAEFAVSVGQMCSAGLAANTGPRSETVWERECCLSSCLRGGMLVGLLSGDGRE